MGERFPEERLPFYSAYAVSEKIKRPITSGRKAAMYSLELE